MDLLQTVRKEGSRGGRAEFKWEDVKNSSHRENYLGHSLMAPVGRWQAGKDLSWYSKSSDDPEALSAEERRKEEMMRIKEAEEDAMNAALGITVARKNPNLTTLGERASDSDAKRAQDMSIDQDDPAEQRAIKDGLGSGRIRGVGPEENAGGGNRRKYLKAAAEAPEEDRRKHRNSDRRDRRDAPGQGIVTGIVGRGQTQETGGTPPDQDRDQDKDTVIEDLGALAQGERAIRMTSAVSGVIIERSAVATVEVGLVPPTGVIEHIGESEIEDGIRKCVA
ncbi:MAG: hypothetical protein M1820_002261 [Bogoriella megaspora]|nr:MAG: hypothetical protein M1820_002261 [Bogoriella megaspora]